MTDGGIRASGSPPYWRRGEHIWWRYRRPGWQPGDPDTVHPMTVVRDDAHALVAWIAPDTPIAHAVRADGLGMRESFHDMFSAPRAQGNGTWFGEGNVRIAPTGKSWSVWLFWDPDGRFSSYYINLEDPHHRDDRNVYTSDHVLDVEVLPDGTHWRKDEHELVAAVEQGRYNSGQAKRFRSTADEVEKLVTDWGSPFCDGWEDFRPDPAWPLPQLPPLGTMKEWSGERSFAR